MDISKLSITELKSMAYDEFVKLEMAQNNGDKRITKGEL